MKIIKTFEFLDKSDYIIVYKIIHGLVLKCTKDALYNALNDGILENFILEIKKDKFDDMYIIKFKKME